MPGYFQNQFNQANQAYQNTLTKANQLNQGQSSTNPSTSGLYDLINSLSAPGQNTQTSTATAIANSAPAQTQTYSVPTQAQAYSAPVQSPQTQSAPRPGQVYTGPQWRDVSTPTSQADYLRKAHAIVETPTPTRDPNAPGRPVLDRIAPPSDPRYLQQYVNAPAKAQAQAEAKYQYQTAALKALGQYNKGPGGQNVYDPEAQTAAQIAYQNYLDTMNNYVAPTPTAGGYGRFGG